MASIATGSEDLGRRKEVIVGEIDALLTSLASKRKELAALNAALAQTCQQPQGIGLDPSQSSEQLPRSTPNTAELVADPSPGGEAEAAQEGELHLAGGRRVTQDGAGAAARQEASLVHKRIKAAEPEDGSYTTSNMLTHALTVMAQNHMLPKEGWSLCKLMHQKVKPFARLTFRAPCTPAVAAQALVSKTVSHLRLRGSFEVDPLLAMSLSAAAPATGAADAFDALFGDVKLITLQKYEGGVFTRIPRTLQTLHIVECSLKATVPLLRAALRASDFGPQRDALKLVKSVCLGHGQAWLPGCIDDLPALTELDLSSCKELEYLPYNLGDLVALTRLNLSECSQLRCLPHSIGNLPLLKDVCLMPCKELSSLPASIGNLASLQKLALGWCDELTNLPACLGDLTALTELRVVSCTALATLPDSIGNLAHLRFLNLDYLPITSLPRSIGSLAALTKLNLLCCDALECLPDTIGELQALTCLDIFSCAGLVALPDTLGSLSVLTEFDLSECTGLTALPISIGDLQALTHLDLSMCQELAALPDSIGNLQSLTRLNLQDCTRLPCLPDSLWQLKRLTSITAKGCQEHVGQSAIALAARNCEHSCGR
eukprot:TRINITY_DN270_c0_g4_i1.p1 TRINITY_DN270_c0_g4~~TRINITY_DN270_c0_g4_i1.p1  ORF type:complete len:634 (+),score=86.52 TRINITY_DN270_c0_g4_i1:100-1902(+)